MLLNTRGSQKVTFPLFAWLEVIGDKKSTPTSLDISPLFFHVVSKLVQALVITYYEIFQALAIEGDVLLPKPFLDLGFDGVVRWKSPASEGFFQVSKHVEIRGSEVAAAWWVGRGPEMALGAGRLFLSPGLGKSHRTLWQVPEQVSKLRGKIEDWCPEMSVCLSCLHLPRFVQKKKTGNLTFWLTTVFSVYTKGLG
jgi:hypothetical protein